MKLIKKNIILRDIELAIECGKIILETVVFVAFCALSLAGVFWAALTL